MQVTHIERGLGAEQAGIGIHGLGVMCKSLSVLEVADVGADEGLLSLSQGEGGLLLGAHGKNAIGIGLQCKRARGIAPAAAQEIGRAAPDRDQGVVTAVLDGPVMQQKAVGHTVQRVQRRLVFGQDRATG